MYSQCVWCEWFMPYGEEPWCKAFPTGIPDVIYQNEFIHTEPYSGDGGIHFKLKSGGILKSENELSDYIKKARDRVE